MTLRSGKLLLAAAAVGLIAGCHWHEGSKPAPATNPSAANIPSTETGQAAASNNPATFKSKGVQITYPGDWQPKKNPDFELMLIARGSTGDEPRITLDVPDLPPHLPFMIQMSRIEHDYLDDLKKSHSDLKMDEDSDVSSKVTIAKLVRSHWMEQSKQHDDVVLLMIHASAVYILDLRTDEPRMKTTRSVFDSMRQSIQWLK